MTLSLFRKSNSLNLFKRIVPEFAMIRTCKETVHSYIKSNYTMNENDDLKRVFTGSFIEAKFIASLLEENGIGALVRNTMEESIIAGWASGAQEDAGLVYVAEYQIEKAKGIIEEYLKTKE